MPKQAKSTGDWTTVEILVFHFPEPVAVLAVSGVAYRGVKIDKFSFAGVTYAETDDGLKVLNETARDFDAAMTGFDDCMIYKKDDTVDYPHWVLQMRGVPLSDFYNGYGTKYQLF